MPDKIEIVKIEGSDMFLVLKEGSKTWKKWLIFFLDNLYGMDTHKKFLITFGSTEVCKNAETWSVGSI